MTERYWLKANPGNSSSTNVMLWSASEELRLFALDDCSEYIERDGRLPLALENITRCHAQTLDPDPFLHVILEAPASRLSQTLLHNVY